MSQEIKKEEYTTPKNRFGFIPFRLELKNFPKYDNFPYNILYVSHANIDGVDMSGSAIYYPDFSTFEEKDENQSMTYFNQYGRDWKVVIYYDKKTKEHGGIKYFKDERKQITWGLDWNMFFAHMTAGGVIKGERVKFEKI